MKETLLFAIAFSLTFTFADLPRFGEDDEQYIDHKAFRLMECEHLIDMDGNEVAPHEGCTFGGYYPWSHPLNYETLSVEIVNRI